MAYEIKRFPYDGTIDADGHILEPPDLWEKYLPEKYQKRALRIKVDDDGYEYLEIDGTPSRRSRRGSLGLLGAMGDEDQKPSPERRYASSMPFGSCNSEERISLLDQENLDATLLYPTLGLLWECELTDPELSLAYVTAYNRWIADFCRDSGGRLVPIAQLTLLDPEGSARELERAVKDGCRGAWLIRLAITAFCMVMRAMMCCLICASLWMCRLRFIPLLRLMTSLQTAFSIGHEKRCYGAQ